MNPRPAAALALVGWYLTMPPAKSVVLKPSVNLTTQWTTPDHMAPSLAKWSIEDSYDTAAQCSEGKQQLMQAAAGSKNPMNPTARAEWLTVQCIATDDPRLKGK
jgi:hypothetical protein